MKFLGFMLVALVGTAFASDLCIEGGINGEYYGGIIATDDIIDSYAYNASQAYTSAYANFAPDATQNYITADDFQITVDASIAELLYWMVNTDANGHPTVVDVFLYADAAPGPGAELQFTTGTVVSTITTIPWGTKWVYECMITLNTPFTFDLGTTYWTAPLRNDGTFGTWYCLVGNVIRGAECYLWYNGIWQAWSTQGYPAQDMFRVMYGSTTPLERNSWGAIKTIF